MTNQEAIKMLTAKVECMQRETSGTDIDCNLRNCDDCELCYAQGKTGEQREALNMAISALQEQRSCDTCKHSTVSKKWPCVDCDMREPADRWEPQEERALDTISRQDAIDEIRKCRFVVDAIEKIIDLPSAQPEPVRINLNEPIKVKLTDLGKEIYYHQYDRTNQIAGREICKPRFPREDENGYTEFQLWCFIELYGMHMGMTLPNVIEPLEIVYER